jgi:hypothetical protein
MRLIIGIATLGWLLFGTSTAHVSADGGSPLFAGTKGGYQITVFAAPTPLRAGSVDISVFVQDALTGNPAKPSRAIVRMTKSGSAALEYPATSEAATNKLFLAAQFVLPEAGCWNIQVEVDVSHGAAVIGGEIEAAEQLPRWAEILRWIVWPALAIVLFSIHQVLARRTDAIPCRRVAAYRATDRPTRRSHPPDSAHPPSRQNRYSH